MDSVKTKGWSRRLYSSLVRLNGQRHFSSVRHAFISTMPIMIIGAFATLINQIPVSFYQNWMVSLFGQNWKMFGALAQTATIQMTAIVITMAIGFNLASWYNSRSIQQVSSTSTGMVALTSYVVISLPLSLENLPFASTGVMGLFVAILASLLSSEIFIQLLLHRNVSIVSENMSKTINMSFSAVVPAIATVLVFLFVRIILIAFGLTNSITDIMYDSFINLFTNAQSSLFSSMAFTLSTNIMWFFGIHGSNVMEQVAQNVFVSAINENIAAVQAGLAPTHIITKPFLDSFVSIGGSGATLSLFLALVIFGHIRNYRTLLKYALPTTFFNINEPILFGLPIVLNPVFLIPFILTPLANFAIAAFATSAGIAPYTIANVPWSTPIFVSGYLSTGSFMGILLQLVNVVIGMFIYAPFVKISENLTHIQFENDYQNLCNAIKTSYTATSRKITDRNDGIGATARHMALHLQNALADNELFLLYQPIVDVKNKSLYSVEALLRWKHPQYGIVDPLLTIALAEDIQKIDKLGLWVLREAIHQRAEWTREGLPDFHVSVNVSTLQLNDPTFHKEIAAILQNNHVPPRQLQLEITETVGLIANRSTHQNLARLKDMGVSIAMDDFGVGHASLMYLRSEKIQTIKIDGALIREINENLLSKEIVATICRLCQQLSIDTIAEYVENVEQLETLLQIGLSVVQGYYFSPPLSPKDMDAFYKKLPAAIKETGIESLS
ncbi:MAG: EAL domain-containing protein [Oscillospiraceae bacterium]